MKLPILPSVPSDAHKGTFGTALIVGGCRGMSGAPVLAGMAALRGGAGLVWLSVPDRIADIVAAFDPCYMTIPLPCDCMGRLSLESETDLARAAQNATAVGLGPGLAQTPGLRELVGRMYAGVPRPMVVDADALNCLATTPELLRYGEGPRILTPHPGEFARLAGLAAPVRIPPPGQPSIAGETARPARAEMLSIAVEKARFWNTVVVLKGQGTLVTDGERQYVNTTGNPGMATGGSGDVLTGLLTALLCRGMAAFDAAVLGVYLHGLAGDLAASRVGKVGMTARNIVETLPEAFQEYEGTKAG